MKKIFICFAISLIIISSLSCHRFRTGKARVAVLLPNEKSNEMMQIKRGIESAPDSIKNESEISWFFAENDINKQEEQIKYALDEFGADVLLIECVSEFRIKKSIELIEKEDVPFVSLNNIPVTRQAYGYVTPNYNFTGKFQAQYAVKAINESGNVIILSGNNFSESYATITKNNKLALEKFDNIFVVFQKYFNNTNDCKQALDSLLKFYKNNISAIIANNDELALNAVEVLKKYNLEKKIITIGAGCSVDAVKSILNNELTMSIDMNFEEVGRGGIIAAVDMANLKPLKNNGVNYSNNDFKVSWIQAPVLAYDKTNISKLINEKKKYTKEQLGLK